MQAWRKSQLNNYIRINYKAFFIKKAKQSDKYIKLCDLFFAWDNFQNEFTAFQDYIAYHLDCTREWACTLINEAVRDGIFYSKYQAHEGNLPNVYAINPFFHQEAVRRELSFLFETFRKHPIRYLFNFLLLTLIKFNKPDSRSQRYEEAKFRAFDSQFAMRKSTAPEKTAQSGGTPPQSLVKNPLNGIEASYGELSEHCKCEMCQIL